MCYNTENKAKEMTIPNWVKNSGKSKKTRGTCKNRIKSRKQALQALKNKLQFK